MSPDKSVQNILAGTNFYVRTYSPGDGITRYRFFRRVDGPMSDYFGPESGIYTALGAKEAHAFAWGLVLALRAG